MTLCLTYLTCLTFFEILILVIPLFLTNLFIVRQLSQVRQPTACGACECLTSGRLVRQVRHLIRMTL